MSAVDGAVDGVLSAVDRYLSEWSPSRIFFLFSGGRDSFLSTYLLLDHLSSREGFEFHVVYVDHGMDFPWMIALAYRSLSLFSSEYGAFVHIVRPSEGFWDFVFGHRYLFPVPSRRWYVRHLVVKPLREFFNRWLDEDSFSTDVIVMGSRYEDLSSRRVQPSGIVGTGTHNVTGLRALFPIAGLSRAQVRDLVSKTPLSGYNDYYPLRGGKPGFWAYLSDSTFSYFHFATRLSLPGADDLFEFVSRVSEMQGSLEYLGPKGRRWNDYALDLLRSMSVDVYSRLIDLYPGLYTSEILTYLRDVGISSEL